MKIQRIDDLYISQPMSLNERLEILKSLFIAGIDKGTSLERDTITKLESIKKKKRDKEFNDFMEGYAEFMQVSIKRQKRGKYKGRYRYSKKKIRKPGGVVRESAKPKIQFKTPNLPSWLK